MAEFIDFIYDVETYPNAFTFAAVEANGDRAWQYEISRRRNDAAALLQFLWYLAQLPGARMVGFNNEGFDYPIIHHIMQTGVGVTVDSIYAKSQAIIGGQNHGDRFGHIIWEADRLIEQVDLYKVHHFDNKAKSARLKDIEFALRLENLADLPFPVGTMLTNEQIDVLAHYNLHGDVVATKAFYHHSRAALQFREELSRQYGRNFVNFNDTKIGKEYLIMKLEEATPDSCYDRSSGRREPRQTHRAQIRVADILFPYIRFEREELRRIHQWFAHQVIDGYNTKGAFKDVTVSVDGFVFKFGLGGIHGSVDSAIVETNADFVILDLDVTSFYPSLAIVNRFYPAHLGATFCDIYAGLKRDRVKHKKGSAPNAMLKLGLNGTFGDSNNIYSPFYDPQYTMTTTINGQLLLCMLAESALRIPGLRLIQANTDGITVYCPRAHLDRLATICKEWETLTRLELEQVRYRRMFIRDVNNYIAEKEDGKLKRKGAYCHETPLQNPQTQELQWHQDHSARVVAKAAEAALLDGEDIRSYVMTYPDPLDFMIRAKVKRDCSLMWGDEQQQAVTRYFISRHGKPLIKIMPPAPRKQIEEISIYLKPDGSLFEARTASERKRAEQRKQPWPLLRVEHRDADDREQEINKGWLTTPCNNLRDMPRLIGDINFEWYIAEAEKLVQPLKPFI